MGCVWKVPAVACIPKWATLQYDNTFLRSRGFNFIRLFAKTSYRLSGNLSPTLANNLHT